MDVEVCVMCVGGVLAWILAGCVHKWTLNLAVFFFRWDVLMHVDTV